MLRSAFYNRPQRRSLSTEKIAPKQALKRRFPCARKRTENYAAGGRVLAHSTNLDTASHPFVPAPRLTPRRPSATMRRSLQSGPVAQLGARFHGMEEVIGSIPIRSTNHFNNLAEPPPMIWQQFGSKIASPPKHFEAAIRSITGAVCCVGCRHTHVGTQPSACAEA